MTTPITMTIPHQLGKTEARARIEQGFGQIQGQLTGAASLANVQQVWQGDRLSFAASVLGQRISGRLDVNERDIRIEVDLPAFLVGIADKIAGRIRRQGTLLLEKK